MLIIKIYLFHLCKDIRIIFVHLILIKNVVVKEVMHAAAIFQLAGLLRTSVMMVFQKKMNVAKVLLLVLILNHVLLGIVKVKIICMLMMEAMLAIIITLANHTKKLF